MEQMLVENLKQKWGPVLDCDGMAPIEDSYRRNVTAILLENEEKALREESNLAPVVGNNADAPGQFSNTNGSFNQVAAFDPVLISLVRRSMPNLIAYDICGVQPMSGPTGLIFAMKAKFATKDGAEALFNEAPSASGKQDGFTGATGNGATGTGFPRFGGTGDPLGDRGIGGTGASDPVMGMTAADDNSGQLIEVGGATGTQMPAFYENTGQGLTTSYLETEEMADMAFVIDRTSVVARTRGLKAEYTSELAQDLKAVHGLDAEVELANILSAEILAEINREVVRTVYNNAKLGAQQTDLRFRSAGLTGLRGQGLNKAATPRAVTNSGGIYDVEFDSDGRWSAEKFRGLMFQIEREANVIAKETRRGKGNFIITTSDVASALAMSGFLNLTPTPDINLTVDDTGNTFAGTLNGRIKVYIDPYAASGSDYVCVGYRGSSPYDAGMFYCPYVPLQMVRAVSETTFQPKIGFKTRYGMVNNPFVSDSTSEFADKSDPHSPAAIRQNQYYRMFRVANLHGGGGATST